MHIHSRSLLLAVVLLLTPTAVSARPRAAAPDPIAALPPKLRALLGKMTLEEKVGQLNQYSGRAADTGPLTDRPEELDHVRQGRVGSMLNVVSAARTRQMQKIAVEESRLHIPLMFAFDVIHGYQTIFPIPLGETASWDLQVMERGARIAAVEASAAGLHWTFAPMVDIARDARWGRVMEGAGEDPVLGSLAAAARVRGFQGTDLSAPDALLACAKHFAAYGAVEAGREYNTVDMSERTLRDVYLPPFEAAARAGAATFMASFNEIAGMPSTASAYLMRDILRGEWRFDGLVVSDWGGVRELQAHGVAADRRETARLALLGGTDIDMEGNAYRDHLAELVRAKKIPARLVDEAAARVLLLKHRLGLFEDPYRHSDEDREKRLSLHPDHLAAARDGARRSIVLLKNQGNLLPLGPDRKRIAVIGALADSKKDMLGNWAGRGEPEPVVTLLAALRTRLGGKTELLHHPGIPIRLQDDAGDDAAIRAAAAVAAKADVILAVLGENAEMSGEAKSRADIGLPPGQEKLLRALYATGKPVVLVLMNGRPLAINFAAAKIPAILETWFLGTMAGPAIADVLFGDYNPSGKLPITFPRAAGQIPIYYNQKSTGRPLLKPDDVWVSRFLDIPNTPLFAFGHGLSYTQFAYSDLQVTPATAGGKDKVTVKFKLSNTGTRAGEEVAQLYVRDRIGSVTRPVMELKAFRKVELQPGASTTVELTLDRTALAFWKSGRAYAAEPGDFDVMVGAASDDIRLRGAFALK